MTLENVEDPFKNRLSFSFHSMGDWRGSGDFQIKKYFSSVSKTFRPSSLNINNIDDLIEEATPSIYYMLCWLEEHYKNKKRVYIPFEVKDVHPFFIPEESIHLSITLIFYKKLPDETNWPWPKVGGNRKIILDFFIFI